MFLVHLLPTFAEVPGIRGAEAVIIDSVVMKQQGTVFQRWFFLTYAEKFLRP